MTTLTPEQEAKEREDAQSLQAITDGALGPEEARRVLRKYNGDLQRALDAFFNGDVMNEQEPPRIEVTTTRTTVAESSTVIDLTQDDDDAAKFYTEQAQQGVQFGPSNREPDPNWQVTLASDKPPSTPQNDASLDHAIQASLADLRKLDDDDLEIFPMEDTLREGQRPIALRPDTGAFVYAALVVQALFAVPQVRQAVARMELPEVGQPPQDPELSSVWHLVELFTNLDRAVLASIVDKDAVPSLGPPEWDGSTVNLPKRTIDFLTKLSTLIECRLGHQPLAEIDVNELPNLFNFKHTEVECRGQECIDRLTHERTNYVPLDLGESDPNELIAKLASMLSKYDKDSSRHDVIAEPSELLMFSIEKVAKLPSYSSTQSSSKLSPKPFGFPKTLYLDRFMRANILFVNERRRKEIKMLAEIEDLTKQKEVLLKHDGRDTMQDLRNTLYYYEHVARAQGNPEREIDLKSTTQGLQAILDILVKGAQEIDRRVEELQAELSKTYDCPELQQHRYELRAVLMHTGLPGRKQIYSYVQDHGLWWKTLDYMVTEVSEETVLTDPTGLHLGAGPYLLIYSRHLPDEEMNAPITWPKIFADSVDQGNETFLSQLPPEIVRKASVTRVSAEGPPAVGSRSSSMKKRA